MSTRTRVWSSAVRTGTGTSTHSVTSAGRPVVWNAICLTVRTATELIGLEIEDALHDEAELDAIGPKARAPEIPVHGNRAETADPGGLLLRQRPLRRRDEAPAAGSDNVSGKNPSISFNRPSAS